MPIRTLEHLKQSAPNDFLRDFIDTAYHWREQPVAAKRKLTGRIETTTEVEVAPELLPPSVTAPVYWNGVLKRPQILIDIGEQASETGSGGLARIGGRWTYAPFITNDDLPSYLHAPSHQWDGADPIAGQQISGLRVSDSPTFASVIFDPTAPAPERATGRIFWDPDNHTFSAHLEGSSTTGQFFMEQLIYGQNDSGGAHPNGTVGYIKGSQGQRPTIDTARADDRVKSLAIVFSTEATIASNESGYYTRQGVTRDIATDAMLEGSIPWLQPTGGYGPNKPPPNINNRNVALGTVIRSHATTGSVLVDIKCFPFIDELSGMGVADLKNGHGLQFNGEYWQNEPWYMHGFLIDDQGVYETTLSYSSATRRPTLTPMGATFSVWISGVKHVFTGAQALPQHGTTSGKYFYYVDENGAFQVSSSPFNLLAWAPVAIVLWNSAKGEGKCCPELHTTRMSARTHERLHEVQGSEVGRRSGFSASGFAYNLDTVAGVTFGISGGLLWDEDIKHIIPSLADGSTYEIWYRTGASGDWTWDSASTLPYKAGTTYATSNAFTGGAWTQVELDGSGAGEYTNMFVVVSPCINGPQIILVQGQGDFASKILAEAQGFDSLDLGTLPWMEYACIYRATFESQVAFGTATKKTVLVSLTRITTASGGSGATAGGEHNSLSGRDAVDCHPAMAITDFYGLTLGQMVKRGSSSMIPAIPNTDYLAVNNPIYTGVIQGPGGTMTGALNNETNWTNIRGQMSVGKSGQAGWYSMRRGSDGSNTGGIGWMASATESNEFRHSAGGGGSYQTFLNNSIERFRIANDGTMSQSGSTFLDSSRKGLFQGVEVQTGTIRVVSFGSGFVKSDSSGVFSSSALLATELPNHASRHHYGGADALAGQSISGLRTVDSPSFASILIGEGGAITGAAGVNDFWRIKGFSSAADVGWLEIATADNGTEPIYVRQYNGNDNGFTSIARTLTLLDASGNTSIPGQLTVSSLGEGFVRSSSSGILSSSALIASDIPNHASRHHWDGADPLVGQSIAGLRTTSSPTFLEMTATGQIFTGWLNLSESGRINGVMGSNDAWRIYGRYNNTDAGYLEIATSDNGNEPIIFRQYTGVSGSFDAIVRELSILDANGNSIFPGRIESAGVWSSTIRLTSVGAGIVRTDSSGYMSIGAISASELPNHASRHHAGGADELTGQSISGLRTVDSPTFSDLNLATQGSVRIGLAAFGVNGLGDVFIRDTLGGVKLFISPSETGVANAFSAASARFSNLTAGIVKSDAIGNLSSSALSASELPSHASRHEYGGADTIAGQSITGLRTVDSPRFLNLRLDGYLRFVSYLVTDYDGVGLHFESTGGTLLARMSTGGGTEIGIGCYPETDGLELGQDARRWNVRSNDLNHDLETLTATNTTPGASILDVPSTGNGFRLVNGSDGSTRNYRIPNGPGAGIMKRLVLFSASVDPTGFTRIYPPSSGQLWSGGTEVTTYIEFGSSAGQLKIVMDSDGSNWYI